jgi:RNA polymerase sigma factor (sigma-70 family)
VNTPLAEQSDAELLAHCRRGGQAAWAVLVRRYQALIYTIPRRAGLPEEAAADVFQFAFVRLFEQLDRIEDPSRLRAWLVTTAKRETLRLLELARRTVALDDAAPADDNAALESWVERLPDPDPLPAHAAPGRRAAGRTLASLRRARFLAGRAVALCRDCATPGRARRQYRPDPQPLPGQAAGLDGAALMARVVVPPHRRTAGGGMYFCVARALREPSGPPWRARASRTPP